MVTFNEIPSANRSPAVFGEFDPVGEPGQRIAHALLIGYRLSGAPAAALALQPIRGESDGDAYFLPGSQLAQICRAFRRVNRVVRVTAIGINEDSEGTAASGTFTITGPATGDGVLAAYIGGRRVALRVADGAAQNAMATALRDAINADTRLPVTAAATTNVVTVTARHRGVYGNSIDLRVNWREGDALPAGVGVTVADMASGAGAADLEPLVAALGEEVYDSIVTGLADDASLSTLEAEVERRWTATVMLDGHIFAAARGSHGALTTLGAARNSPATTLVGAGPTPTVPWVVAAQVAGRELSIPDPGLPRFGLTLPDVEAPKAADRFDHAERNLLLFSGVSTLRVDAGGRVIIDRLLTTSQTNALGQPDATWLALSTRRTTSFLRFDWVARCAAKYQRKKLADDGTQVDPGVPVVTPSVLKGEAITWYQEKIRQGHVENLEAFKRSLAAVRPDGDPERINMLQEPDITNELVTIATKFAFRV